MVVTADGRYHLLANLGTQGGANASLYLLSSNDGVTGPSNATWATPTSTPCPTAPWMATR
jgi:hypothetical protein